MELLVTIGVIALLAALLLPAISRSKERARQIQCVANLRQLGLGLQSFVAENHVYPTLFSGTNTDHLHDWIYQLEQGGFDVATPTRAYRKEGVWNCPSARWATVDPPATTFCYGYNACGVSGLSPNNTYRGLSGNPISRGEGCMPVKESEVVCPSDMMAMGDSFDGTHVFARGFLAHKERVGFASSRHSAKANVVFCDGHVESPPLQLVFTDTNDTALVRWNRDHQPHRECL
jgi:prepilin-type processing-associated H-X9-DG protein